MITEFKETVRQVNPEYLTFERLKTVQVNLGNLCNQQCTHCHQEAGPHGDRIMSRAVMEKIIDFLRENPGHILDITGGCPEMNPYFKQFVETARPYVSRLMVRTNLTIMEEQGMEWLPQWYKDHDVVVIASLPCYTQQNVDCQRGNGVFEKSIQALSELNNIGYADQPTLELDLVYNPGKEVLPASQDELEKAYKDHLFNEHGIRFNHLFTITNAPLGRFKNYLKANGKLEQYMTLLADNFNPQSAANIMCRTLVSIDYRGILFNCDFNQVLDLPIKGSSGEALTIDNLSALHKGDEIITEQHCYCCTAGEGSSCTGALV